MKITVSVILAFQFFLAVFLVSPVQAQSFYPLEIGNRWVYDDTSYSFLTHSGYRGTSVTNLLR